METVQNSKQAINLENKYGAHNYHPLPVVLAKVKEFMFGMLKEKNTLIFYQHTLRLIKVIVTQKVDECVKAQAETLTLTSRAFYNDVLGRYEQYVTDFFQFDKVLPMNTGAEAVETAIKLCRKWAYEIKVLKRIQKLLFVGDFTAEQQQSFLFLTMKSKKKFRSFYTWFCFYTLQ